MGGIFGIRDEGEVRGMGRMGHATMVFDGFFLARRSSIAVEEMVNPVCLLGDSVSKGFIRPHGGYRNLLSFRKAENAFEATIRFCERFLDRHDRTCGQMVQAARSGKQNIVEGSQAPGTSSKTEIWLTSVARASLEELLKDYEDFPRVRGMEKWDKDCEKSIYARNLGRGTNVTYETHRTFVETRPAETVANIIICIIHQANYLLDRQIKRLEKDFVENGGVREAMTRARIEERDKRRREDYPRNRGLLALVLFVVFMLSVPKVPSVPFVSLVPLIPLFPCLFLHKSLISPACPFLPKAA